MNCDLLHEMTERKIKSVLDIGANTGQFACWVKSCIPDAYVLSIEPNPNCEKYLRSLNLNYIMCCPSDTKGIKSFYMNRVDPVGTGNSLYRENTHHFSDENTIVVEVNTDTMDSILDSAGVGSIIFDMIKIDTQGSELDILRGCTKILTTTKLVVAETDVGNYNQGCPTQKEVIDYMESMGFRSIGSSEDHFSDGRLIQQDILFERMTP